MSPLLETFGVASARGWRLNSVSLSGRGFWAVIADSTGTASNTGLGGMAVGGTGTVYISIVLTIINQQSHWYGLDAFGNFLYRLNNSVVTVTSNSYSGAKNLAAKGSTGLVSTNDSATANQSYIIRNNATMVGQWSRSFTDASISPGSGASGSTAMDSSGNAYFGTQGAGSTTAAAFVKYDSAGTIQWQRKLSGLGTVNQAKSDVCVDGQGNPTFVNCIASTWQIFRYNSSGVIQWQRQILGVNTSDYHNYVAGDSVGNVIIATNTGASGANIILTKLTSAGATSWQRQITSGLSGISYTIIDDSDNVYTIIGSTNGGNTIYILKYNSSGTLQWQRSVIFSGTSTTFTIRQVAFNPAGYITIAGGLGAPSGGYSNPPAILQYPTTGSPVGAFTASGYTATIASSSLTEIAGSTAVSTTTFTDAAGTGTDAAASVHATTANSTVTNTTTAVV